MATIVNNPNGTTADSGLGTVLGVVIGILLVLFLVVYGMPVIRESLRSNTTTNSQPSVQVNLPDVTPGASGSSAQ